MIQRTTFSLGIKQQIFKLFNVDTTKVIGYNHQKLL
jgi:hypothetical protein